jgi:excisionase family DNA binding protein
MEKLACYCGDMEIKQSGARAKLTYSLGEVAEALGLSQVYVRKLASEGKIATVRFGKRVMVRGLELERVAAEGVA